MGGEITAESLPGQGSTFTLRLLLAEATAPTTTAALDMAADGTDLRLAGLRVLVAEDVEVNRLILKDMLDEAGATSDFAENGQLAVEKITAAPTVFDVVLMDVQMPEMDGYETTRRIRQLPGVKLLIAESAEDGLSAGFAAYVTKPFDVPELLALVRTTLQDEGHEPHR